MPKIPTLRTKQHPAGWELLEPTLTQYQNQMKDAENESHEGQRQTDILWKIIRIHHERSRFIYEMFYQQKEISRDLYEYCLREKWADEVLIAKWKKSGYQKLCCISCIQNTNHHFGGACICRVPKSKLEEGKLVECKSCGCRGCASCD